MAAERPLRPSDANPPVCLPAWLLAKTAVLSGSVSLLHILIRTALGLPAERTDLFGGWGGGITPPPAQLPCSRTVNGSEAEIEAIQQVPLKGVLNSF